MTGIFSCAKWTVVLNTFTQIRNEHYMYKYFDNLHLDCQNRGYSHKTIIDGNPPLFNSESDPIGKTKSILITLLYAF